MGHISFRNDDYSRNEVTGQDTGREEAAGFVRKIKNGMKEGFKGTETVSFL